MVTSKNMKKSRLFIVSSLAMLLGIGVFVGTNSVSQAIETKAAATNYTDTAVYLDTSTCWKSGSNDERFAAYWSTGSENGWYSMIEISSNFYGARLPEKDITLVIFVRFPKNNSTNDWKYKWNQTGDLSVGDFNKSSAVFKVDSWDNAGKTCWKANSGYTSKFVTRYVACADNGWVANSADYKLTLDMTKAESRLEKVFSISGTETYEGLKLTDGTWDNSYGVQYVVDGTSSTYVDLSEGGNNNIRLLVNGTYEIYWKHLATDSKNIWIQIGSDTEADAYAQSFIAAITCTNTSTTFALNAWNKVGSEVTSMEYKYEKLTSGARHLLQNATASQSGSNVEKCVARYDRVLYKYGYGSGEGQYHDFMGRTPATLVPSGALLNNSFGSNGASTIAIITITSVSLVAIGGYFLFKKKHN